MAIRSNLCSKSAADFDKTFLLPTISAKHREPCGVLSQSDIGPAPQTLKTFYKHFKTFCKLFKTFCITFPPSLVYRDIWNTIIAIHFCRDTWTQITSPKHKYKMDGQSKQEQKMDGKSKQEQAQELGPRD